MPACCHCCADRLGPKLRTVTYLTVTAEVPTSEDSLTDNNTRFGASLCAEVEP
jgi:hypothetical protein